VLAIKRYINSRGLCLLRRDCPILFYLPGFFFGQVSLLIFGRGLVLAAVCVAVICLFVRKKHRTFLLSFVCGLASALPLLFEGAVFLDFDNKLSYLARVDETPRYRKPGSMNLSLKLSGVVINSDESGQAKPGYSILEPHNRIRVLCKAVDLPWRNNGTLREDSWLFLKARLKPIHQSWPMTSYESNLYRHGYRASCKIDYIAFVKQGRRSWAARLREKISDVVYGQLGRDEISGMLLAMSIGAKDRLTDKTERAYKRSGLAHTLVVSGYHISVVFYFLSWLIFCAAIRSRLLMVVFPAKYPGWLVGVAGTTGYVLICGLSGPGLRAEIALIFFVISRIFERGANLLNSLLISLLVVCVVWPGAFLEPGVQLTFFALFGICCGLTLTRGCSSKSWRYFVMCSMASLFSSLPVVYWFKHFSIAGFVLNPLLAPILILVGCKGTLIGIMLTLCGLDRDALFLKGCQFVMAQFRAIVIAVGTHPCSAINVSEGEALLACTLLAVVMLVPIVRCVRNYLLENNAFSPY